MELSTGELEKHVNRRQLIGFAAAASPSPPADYSPVSTTFGGCRRLSRFAVAAVRQKYCDATDARPTVVGSLATAEKSQTATAVESRDGSAARSGNEPASRKQKCNFSGNMAASRVAFRRIK